MFFLNLFLFLVSFVVDVHLRRRRRRRRKRGKNVFSKEGKLERFLAFVKSLLFYGNWEKFIERNNVPNDKRHCHTHKQHAQRKKERKREEKKIPSRA